MDFGIFLYHYAFMQNITLNRNYYIFYNNLGKLWRHRQTSSNLFGSWNRKHLDLCHVMQQEKMSFQINWGLRFLYIRKFLNLALYKESNWTRNIILNSACNLITRIKSHLHRLFSHSLFASMRHLRINDSWKSYMLHL